MRRKALTADFVGLAYSRSARLGKPAAAWVSAMQKKKKKKVTKVPTEFQRRVYALVKTIPKGKVATYGSIAAALEPKSCARAVGQAMRNNPYFPEVP
mmetsp:Transcript_7325/g.10071  ORF Transcript_7325/g.10071 Transcript_7325/m.10071 type:complete len:97 (+) Transcript_7325:231-521(+)